MEKEKRKKVILLIVGIVTILIVTIGATYAYFRAQLGTGGNVQVGATTGTTDHLTFSLVDIEVDTGPGVIDILLEFVFKILFLIFGTPKHTPITNKVAKPLQKNGIITLLKKVGFFFFFSEDTAV